MSDPSKERRYKILLLNDDLILDLLQAMSHGFPQFIKLPKLKGLPIDIEILSVSYDLSIRAFQFLIAHQSFDKCPIGTIPFMIDEGSIIIDQKQYKLIKQ